MLKKSLKENCVIKIIEENVTLYAIWQFQILHYLHDLYGADNLSWI